MTNPDIIMYSFVSAVQSGALGQQTVVYVHDQLMVEMLQLACWLELQWALLLCVQCSGGREEAAIQKILCKSEYNNTAKC